MKSGFTLVETIVALVLFQLGVVALAATMTLAARDLSEAVLRRQAAVVARNRVESLLATVCTNPNPGTTPAGPGATEHWFTESRGVARIVTDSVAVVLPGGRRAAVVARAWRLCPA